MFMVSKKRATTNDNSNNNTCKMQEEFGKLLDFSSLCIGSFLKCPNTSDKGHHYISECKQRKCRRLPPQSPDLNIIENIWDELNRRVRRTGSIPTIPNQLRAKILYEWINLPQNLVQLYVTSMRRRCLP